MELPSYAAAVADYLKLDASYRVTLNVDEEEAPKESFSSNWIEYTFIGSDYVGAKLNSLEPLINLMKEGRLVFPFS